MSQVESPLPSGATAATVTACLPGALLTGVPTPERVDGMIRVKLGPISADFGGAARIGRDPENLTGRIVGMGSDQPSRSSTQGEILNHLVPIKQGAATRVELSIGNGLKGMLAQIGNNRALWYDSCSIRSEDFS